MPDGLMCIRLESCTYKRNSAVTTALSIVWYMVHGIILMHDLSVAAYT